MVYDIAINVNYNSLSQNLQEGGAVALARLITQDHSHRFKSFLKKIQLDNLDQVVSLGGPDRIRIRNA